MSQKHIVAIYLASPERSKELGEILTAAGMTSVCTGNTDELYRAINGQRVDLLVLEDKLPGFLTGLEILTRLHAELVRPTTILMGGLSSAQKEKAESIGVASIVSASTSLAELAETARKSLIAPKNPPMLQIPLEARRLVQASDTIQPLPQVLIKIAKHLDHNNATITDLANDIALDARLTAMLLRLVNSTAFALRTKMTKVHDAVNYLGIRRTVSLVISSYLITAQSELSKNLPDTLRMWHQRRSVLIASAAAAFARHSDGLSTETAYVMGLMQDFGILVMAGGIGERYIQLVDRVKEIGALRLSVLEEKSFGVTHAEVSAALLQKWELPASFIPCVLYHHPQEDKPAMMSPAERRFLHVMQIGEALANVLDSCTAHRNQILNRLLEQGDYGTPEDVKACLSEAVAKTAESSQLFSIPAPDPEMLKSMLEKVASDLQSMKDGTVEDEDIESNEAVMGAAEVPPGTPFVVIIDDNAAEAEAISSYLTAAGIWPLKCSSTKEAQQRSHGAKAVLSDIASGSKDPMGFVRQLRTDGYQGNIIAMSHDRSRTTVERAIAAGISNFLPKPFTKTMLLEKLGVSPVADAQESSRQSLFNT